MSLEKFLKEAFEPPLASQMRFLAMIQQPFGIPPEPKLTKEAAYGLSKIAQILGQEPSEESSLQLQRAAMVDPQIQQALDFQQAQAEREEALAQVEQMNQQLFEAQSAQAAAEQQVQQAGQQMEQMGQQAAQLQEQLNQEQMMRQEVQTQLVAARDQSLQEQISAQDQKAQMNQSAEIFRQQADQLAQQLKAVAMQSTTQPPMGMMGAPGQPGQPGGEMPPPMTAGTAQEQQQAMNAEQEAGIQGQQAQEVTAQEQAMMAQQQQQQPQPGSPEEQAMMEQQMAAQGGQPQPGSPEEQAMMAQQQGGMPPEAMPKQGSDIRATYQRAMLKMAGVSKTDNQQKSWSEAKKVSARAGGAVGKALRTLGIKAGVAKEKAKPYVQGAKPHVQGAKETAQEFKGSMKREMEKGGQLLAIPIQHAPQHLDPRTAAREGAIRGLTGGGLLGGALGVAAGMRGPKASLLRGALGGLSGAVAGGSALGIAGGGLSALQAKLNRDRVKANLLARASIAAELKGGGEKTAGVFDRFKVNIPQGHTPEKRPSPEELAKTLDAIIAHQTARKGEDPGAIRKAERGLKNVGASYGEGSTKQASFQEIIGNPKIQGAVIGAAIGALGGAGAGAVPGTLAGTATAPSGERGSGAMKGTGRGMIGGALAGAAGGALVGATIGGGKAGQQWGRLVGGGALMLSAPGVGALAAGAGGLSDRSKRRVEDQRQSVEKSAAINPVLEAIGRTGLGAAGGGIAGTLAGGLGGGIGGALAAEPGERGEGFRVGSQRGARAGLAFGALTGGLHAGMRGPAYLTRTVEGPAQVITFNPQLQSALHGGQLGSLAGALVGTMEPGKIRARKREEESDREQRQLLPEEQMPKESSASDVARRIMAQKGIGALVGAGAGAGYGGIEAGLERKTPVGQPTDKQIDLQARSEAAKIKAELDPTFLNKLKALKAETSLKTEDVLREHPGGRMAWRAGQGAILGGGGETAIRTLAGPTKLYGSSIYEGVKSRIKGRTPDLKLVR